MGMAEAMALGKPVIGTDFSGNCDFLTADTGFLVPYVIRPLIAGEYPNSAGQSWAEPDLKTAIEQLRLVVNNPFEREQRAAQGRRRVREHYSAETVAKAVETRLRAIRQQKGLPLTASQSVARSLVHADTSV